MREEGILTVTRRFEFDFAHWLPKYEGKCRSLHGHRGVLEVEVSGSPKSKISIYPTMVVDFTDLKRIVEERIINKFDHKCLNDFLEVPTAEEVVRFVVRELDKEFGKNLVRVRFYETPDSYAEWRRL